MRRLSHDLPGSAQRLAKLSNEFDLELQELSSDWKDRVGRQFAQRYGVEVRPTIASLVSELAEMIERFDAIQRNLLDANDSAI